MKILVAQDAVLTNAEVLAHLQSMRKQYGTEPEQSGKTQPLKSENLETIKKEVIDYLQTPPSPLVPPTRYSGEVILKLLRALQPFGLTKSEMLMIFNLRPQDLAVLDTVIEEMDDRFTEGRQEEILQIIQQVIGKDEEAEGGAMGEITQDKSIADATEQNGTRVS